MSDTFYRHKDRDLINLVLTEADWNCISQLIEVLAPLKEATLLASQNGESLMVTSMIPIYDYCTEMLKESLKIFDENDDIYIGIKSAIEKLNHYYDKVSPMVGIALILDPTLKKDSLKKSLGWKVEWVDSVMDQFSSSFHFYREKSKASASIASAASVSSGPSPRGFGNFLKKRRTADGDADGVEEFVRYFNAPLAEMGTNPLLFWKTNQFHYPILSAMAKDYLTVQASSVASERAFIWN
jgi:hypothetical protein